jgi:hypothetical protein
MKKVLSLVLATVFTFGALTVKADEGMWILSLLKKQNIEKMQEMGLKLTAEDIYDVNNACLKDAIVGLGNAGRPFRHFCTGELISGEGLLLTNHHCGFGALQSHSTTEHDYLQDGFWAYEKKQELTNEGITASILVRIEDATEKVLAAVNDDMTEEERGKAVAAISKELSAAAVEGTKFHAHVQSMFNGNQYFIFVYNIFQDVRLVGAPPQSMGKFGGDTDNWMWPRHTADFSMFRIYTAADGSSAPYSADNVPLKPKHFLPISTKGAQEGDFAMVMGFPGTTDHYLTSYGLKQTMDVTNKLRYEIRTEKLRVMKAGMVQNQKTRIQYSSKYAGCANYWKYSKVQNEALKKLNTMGNKKSIEAEFTAWVDADAGRQAKYGKVLAMLDGAFEANRDLAIAKSYTFEALAGAEAHMFAAQLGGLEDMIGDPEKAEKWAKVKVKVAAKAKEFFKNFNAEVETNLISTLFAIYDENVDAKYMSDDYKKLTKKYKGKFEKFAKRAAKKSIFMNEAKFNKWLENPSAKVLKKDILFKAGKAFYSTYRLISGMGHDNSVSIKKGNRLFVDALLQMQPEKAWSPDANSTLRLTYGKVGGYEAVDAVYNKHYTTMKGIIEKEDPNNDEFVVPARLIELYNAKDFGAYAENGELHTCFLTDNDITGGNSGSPVINANGELIGTAFDGNSEAMSGDIDFEENLQRCINLDVRYMLWIVDKFAGAKNLIEEMEIR